MMDGRYEPPPEEQLAELRKARDRYADIAEETHNHAMDEAEAVREQNARRIAGAYEKSIANMIANAEGVNLHESEGWTASLNRSRTALVKASVFVVAAAGVAFVALTRSHVPAYTAPVPKPRAVTTAAAIPKPKTISAPHTSVEPVPADVSNNVQTDKPQSQTLPAAAKPLDKKRVYLHHAWSKRLNQKSRYKRHAGLQRGQHPLPAVPPLNQDRRITP